MKQLKKAFVATLLVLSMVSVLAVPATQAFGLGDILKVGGVGYLVDRFSGQLNDFINGLTAKNGMGSDYATKVVPIISIGGSGYIGAAQVMGPQELVEQTAAVLQVEGSFADRFRAKALIPANSKNPTNASRVQGVGVSAIIDVKI